MLRNHHPPKGNVAAARKASCVTFQEVLEEPDGRQREPERIGPLVLFFSDYSPRVGDPCE